MKYELKIIKNIVFKKSDIKHVGFLIRVFNEPGKTWLINLSSYGPKKKERPKNISRINWKIALKNVNLQIKESKLTKVANDLLLQRDIESFQILNNLNKEQSSYMRNGENFINTFDTVSDIWMQYPELDIEFENGIKYLFNK